MRQINMEPVTQSPNLTSSIEAQIVAAEHALIAATGGENVCRLDKAGRATGGMKYNEGRLVALRAARRLAQSAKAAETWAAVRQLRDEWHANLRTQQARERPAPQWLAYTQGGADALDQLLGLTTEAHDE